MFVSVVVGLSLSPSKNVQPQAVGDPETHLGNVAARMESILLFIKCIPKILQRLKNSAIFYINFGVNISILRLY